MNYKLIILSLIALTGCASNSLRQNTQYPKLRDSELKKYIIGSWQPVNEPPGKSLTTFYPDGTWDGFINTSAEDLAIGMPPIIKFKGKYRIEGNASIESATDITPHVGPIPGEEVFIIETKSKNEHISASADGSFKETYKRINQ